MKLFYELDEKNYLVKKNVVLKKILSILESKYDVEDIQGYIDKLISWYSIKFPNHYLISLLNNDVRIDTDILKIMDFDTLQKNYTAFEREVFENENLSDGMIVLQKYLIVAAGWGLIYYENTSPEFGFYRATRLLEDFNSCYGWNLSASIYKPILKKEYSLNNPEIVHVLKEKKKQKREKKEISQKGKFSKLKKYIKSRRNLKK